MMDQADMEQIPTTPPAPALQGPVDENCTFCKIASRQDSGTELLYEDEDYVAFRDIKPATEHHYLISPKVHLLNVKTLLPEHVPVVKKLVEIGKQLIIDRGGDLVNAILGFHWPPFNTIAHLHMHAITSIDQMSFVSKGMFKTGTLWFVSPEYVIDRLEKM